MAYRVTSAEVLEIMDTTLTEVTAFITVANLIVTDKLGAKGLSDDLMKEIERWLSAHFATIKDPSSTEDKIGSSTQKKLSLFLSGEGLKGTKYGQQVLLLDPTGTLVNIGKLPVTFKVDDFREA
jgi:hypothetical protein